jgi:hypothetical protein
MTPMLPSAPRADGYRPTERLDDTHSATLLARTMRASGPRIG